VNAITTKIQSSCLEMNAQELGNALYGLQDMTSDYPEVITASDMLCILTLFCSHAIYLAAVNLLCYCYF
jgi:hypothetical protein